MDATTNDSARLAAAWHRFDEENSRDPNTEVVDGRPRPRELVYAEWLSGWVRRLCPNASEELLLAARSQHLCRWIVPRESYPMTRAGYLQWREGLKRIHADKASAILQEVGYAAGQIARVRDLILKKGFPSDPESRVLEDALCLVFLERQLGALAAKLSDEKLTGALRKAWAKMTPVAREIATALPYGSREGTLLKKALDPAAP